MPSERPLSARDVILEIVNNMREGIEPLLYSSLAPAVFTVFLHADDYERLHPGTRSIVPEDTLAQPVRSSSAPAVTATVVRRMGNPRSGPPGVAAAPSSHGTAAMAERP